MTAYSRLTVLVLVLSVGGAGTAGAQPLARYSAVTMEEIGGISDRVEITITRWTTDAERDQLQTALFGGGSDRFLEVLRALSPTGSVRVGDDLVIPLRYAREVRSRMSTLVILATNRPVPVGTAAEPETDTYRLSFIDLEIDVSGRIRGSLAAAAELALDEVNGTLDLVEDSSRSVRFRSVEQR
jgi:hypothetical protein